MQKSELPPAVSKLLEGYPVVVTTMVAWGDMDANQHVNNAVYFRYIEHARLQYFHDLGFWELQRQTGVGPILAWADCRFRRPLDFPDTVSIGARIRDIALDRFEMDSIIVSHKLGDIAAIGQQKLVSYDYRNQQKIALPEVIRERIAVIEGASPCE